MPCGVEAHGALEGGGGGLGLAPSLAERGARQQRAHGLLRVRVRVRVRARVRVRVRVRVRA